MRNPPRVVTESNIILSMNTKTSVFNYMISCSRQLLTLDGVCIFRLMPDFHLSVRFTGKSFLYFMGHTVIHRTISVVRLTIWNFMLIVNVKDDWLRTVKSLSNSAAFITILTFQNKCPQESNVIHKTSDLNRMKLRRYKIPMAAVLFKRKYLLA